MFLAYVSLQRSRRARQYRYLQLNVEARLCRTCQSLHVCCQMPVSLTARQSAAREAQLQGGGDLPLKLLLPTQSTGRRTRQPGTFYSLPAAGHMLHSSAQAGGSRQRCHPLAFHSCWRRRQAYLKKPRGPAIGQPMNSAEHWSVPY